MRQNVFFDLTCKKFRQIDERYNSLVEKLLSRIFFAKVVRPKQSSNKAETLPPKTDVSLTSKLIGVATGKWSIKKRFCRVHLPFQKIKKSNMI